MSSTYRFSFPTSIHFGVGARHQLTSSLKEQGLSNPWIITDRGLVELRFVREIRDALSDAFGTVGIFSDFGGNPVLADVNAGVQNYRQAHADCIVALGGGAVLDVAKAVALMIHHPGELFDYEDGKPDALPVDQHIPYLVALPTTAGTGSEVGRSAVISTDDTHAKKIIFDPRLLPPVVLADPELTVDLPPSITAATGMDALTHNVEAFLAKGWHPMADGIALEALHMIAQSLVRAVKQPDDLQARANMLMASMMGAVAFQKGLGITHSLAHPLSTVCDLHHGLANAIMLPHAIAFNADTVPQRLARMAAAVNAPSHDARGLIAWLDSLRQAVGIPARLSEVGVKPEHVEDLVRFAVVDVCHALNPREVTEDDFRQIYRAAL